MSESERSHVVTGEGINLLALSTLIRALEREVSGSGMRMTSRMPTLRQIRQRYGVSGRTKVQVIEELKKQLAVRERGSGLTPREEK